MGELRNVLLLVAVGVNDDGYRDILGICEGAKEDKAGWSAFLKHLKERGLSGVEFVVSDACLDLVESLAEVYAEARWQRCVVHFYRNVFSHVPVPKMCEAANMLKAIHVQEGRESATKKAEGVIAKPKAMRLAEAAELVDTHIAETSSFYALPDQTWIKLKTNNPLERIMWEMRAKEPGSSASSPTANPPSTSLPLG